MLAACEQQNRGCLSCSATKLIQQSFMMRSISCFIVFQPTWQRYSHLSKVYVQKMRQYLCIPSTQNLCRVEGKQCSAKSTWGKKESFHALFLAHDDHKNRSFIFGSPKGDVLRNVKKDNIIQAQFLHTLSHSSICHSVKVWTFCSYCFAHEEPLKKKTLHNPSMLYLGSRVFGRVPISRERWKCLFRVFLPTFHVLLKNTRCVKAQKAHKYENQQWGC